MKIIQTSMDLRQEIQREIQKKHQAGKTYRELAVELKLPLTTIYRLLQTNQPTAEFKSRRPSELKFENCTRIARRLGIKYCFTNIPHHNRGLNRGL